MRTLLRLLVSGSAAASLLAAGLPAAAHGIWFAQRSGDLALIYGEGGDDLDAAKRVTLLRSATGYDTTGHPVPVSIDAVGKLAIVDLRSEPAVVGAVLDNGVWTKATDGTWHKKPKDDVPGAAVSSRNFKYAVHMRAPLVEPLRPLPEHTLQIVPVDAALPAHKGDLLRVRVLYRGRPLAGAPVVADFIGGPDDEPLLTREDGTVTLPIRNQGLNVIAVKWDAPPDDPALTDKVEHLATLSFRLAHAPE